MNWALFLGDLERGKVLVISHGLFSLFFVLVRPAQLLCLNLTVGEGRWRAEVNFHQLGVSGGPAQGPASHHFFLQSC